MGIVTTANLRLAPAVVDRAVGWAVLKSPHDALRLLQLAEAKLGNVVEGFEILPEDGVTSVLRHIPGTRRPVEGSAAWHALIEIDLERSGSSSAARLLEDALADAMEQGIIEDAAIANSEAQAEAMWKLRETLPEAQRAEGPALQFDISVPVAAMPDFIVGAKQAVETEFAGCHALSFGHLGDGNVHFHVRAPAGQSDGEAWVAAMAQRVSRFVNDRVVAAQGSISAEHGIGQLKREEFARLAEPGRIAAILAIKAALDPQGLMNPGKLLPLASES